MSAANLSHSSHQGHKIHLHCTPTFAPNGPNALARAVNKYGIKQRNGYFLAPDGPKGRILRKEHHESDKETTTVKVDSILMDLEYTMPVQIGTPGQVLDLNLDSGSSDFWVWSTDVKNSRKNPPHDAYNPKKSSTADLESTKNLEWDITFGDGSWARGNVVRDNVQMGDIVVVGQAVEVATKLSTQFLQDVYTDGLCGMAFGKINTVTDKDGNPKPQMTLMEQMMKQGLIQSNVYTANLTLGGKNAFYSFGTIVQDVTSQPINYVPVQPETGFWMVESKTWKIDGKEVQMSGGKGIADTGTTLMLVPDDLCAKIYAAIPGAKLDSQAGGYVFPANAKVPEISCAIGPHQIKLDPKTLSYGDAFDGMVFGGIQSSGDLGFAIYGDVFFKNCYVVFDQGQNRLGVAQRDSIDA
ncbi:acid protease [Pseudohyphozyma bogoriensis]|nr:acid protease [Pseudohyphozyma bogoriensis]